MVTSLVLNEGVDIPAANAAIAISGSGSVREHAQRLAAFPSATSKRALYELYTAMIPAEAFTSEREEGARCLPPILQTSAALAKTSIAPL